MIELKIIKPQIWNFEIVKGVDSWREVAYSAKVSGVPSEIKDEDIFKMIVKNDYGSTLEHVIIKFDLKMTKGNAPELLEHRITSHTGFSTRYIKVQEGIDKAKPQYEVIMPPYLKDEKEKEKFLELIKNNIQFYEDLLAKGVPKEGARYALPFCQAVGIYHFTINLRSFLNLLSLRLCVRTSPEFRCLASQLYFLLIEKLPILRGLVGCRGFMKAACPESGVTGVRMGEPHKYYPPCPFKNKETDVFIPTAGEIRSGINNLQKFDKEKAIKMQEAFFQKWANWEE